MKIKYKLLLLLGIVILISVISIANIFASVPSKVRKTVISSAQKKNLTQTVTVEGVVEPVKMQVIDISPTQKVLEVFVNEGQDVKKGDLILKLDISEDQHKLNTEEINLKLAERELSKLLRNEEADKNNVENIYKQAEIAFSVAKSNLDASLNKLAADELLLGLEAISKMQLEQSQKDVRDKEYEMSLKTMELDRAYQSLENFDLDKDAQIFKLESDINLINENINYLKSKVDAATRADIDGRVVKLEFNQDMYTSQENSQILIYDMSEYIVNVQPKQQEAIYIKEGLKAKIRIKGIEEKEYNGTVIDADEIATYSSDGDMPKLNVKIRIDDPDEQIRMGYEAEVKISLNIKPEAVVVDFESIIEDRDGKKYIYFVENDIAKRKVVSTGIETSYEVEITEGIIQGDRYVVNPPEEMQSKNSMKIWGWRYESR